MVALLRRIIQMIFNLFNKGDIKPVRKASGSNIFIDDSANLPLVSMCVYGNSTQDGTPTPDSPIDIVSVGDSGTLDIKSVGKNLLDMTHKTGTTIYEVTSTVNEDKSVSLNSNGITSVDVYFTIGKFNFKKGESYILSGCPVGGNSNTLYSLYVNIDGGYKHDIGNGVLITPQADSECSITALLRKGNTADNLTFYPMLRLAEVKDATYEPYKENVTYISLDEPLRSVGEVKDEIVKQDGVWGVLRRIACKQLTTAFKNQGSNSNNYGYYQRFGDVGGTTVLSDKLSYKPMTTVLADGATMDTLGVSATPLYGGVVYFNVGYYLTDKTVEGVTAWLADNPITVEYELATETFTPFADQTPFNNMVTYNPVTIISSDAEMDIEYVDMSYDQIVGKIYDELTDINSRITRIITPELVKSYYVAMGVTFSYDSDINGIIGTGTCNGSGVNYKLTKVSLKLPVGTHELSGCPMGGSSSTYCLQLTNSDGAVIVKDYGCGAAFTLTEETVVDIYAYAKYGAILTDEVFTPKIKLNVENKFKTVKCNISKQTISSGVTTFTIKDELGDFTSDNSIILGVCYYDKADGIYGDKMITGDVTSFSANLSTSGITVYVYSPASWLSYGGYIAVTLMKL